ncbi:hypothetical protein OBY50_000766 [Campylobacter upsaliensis]|nr:hypothetical protein [Campylobacter upsaliensis]
MAKFGLAFCLAASGEFAPATRLTLLDPAPPPHKKGVKFSLFCEAFLPCSRLS